MIEPPMSGRRCRCGRSDACVVRAISSEADCPLGLFRGQRQGRCDWPAAPTVVRRAPNGQSAHRGRRRRPPLPLAPCTSVTAEPAGRYDISGEWLPRAESKAFRGMTRRECWGEGNGFGFQPRSAVALVAPRRPAPPPPGNAGSGDTAALTGSSQWTPATRSRAASGEPRPRDVFRDTDRRRSFTSPTCGPVCARHRRHHLSTDRRLNG
jgi:hypothetical protein